MWGLIGTAAIFLVQGSLLPKMVSLWKSRKAGGVLLKIESRMFWVMLFSGLVLFLAYAIHIKDPVYIASNAVGVVNSGFVLWMLVSSKGE